MSDDELLCRSLEREDKLQRTVHGRTKRLAFRLSLVVAALAVICSLATWRLVT